jgi:dolichyl-phosphooligosaccharide-protein glycotransferase
MKHNLKKYLKENKKTINVIITILLILIPMIVGIGIRMQSVKLTAIDNFAEENVLNFYKQQLTNEVNNRYAYMPEEKRNELVNDNLREFIKENNDRLKNEIFEMSEMMKDGLRDENGTPYLTDIDTWMSYFYTNNYLNTGTVGNEVRDGTAVTTLRDGRNDRFENNRFHPWMMSINHKIFRLFDKDIPVMKSVSFYVMILAILSLIPAFMIGKRLSNNLGGFITSMIIAVHPVVMARTITNFADDDVYHLLFPLLTIWMIVEAFHTKDTKKQIIFSSLAGLSVALHSISWSGWWYGSLFAFASLFIFALYKIITNLNENKNIKEVLKKSKNSLIMFGTYFVSQIFFVALLAMTFSKTNLINALKKSLTTFTGPLWFLQLYDVGTSSIWPNVMVTVAELKRIPLSQTMSQVGETLFIFMALIGLAILFLRDNYKLNKIEKIMFWSSIIYYSILTVMINNISNIYSFVILTALPIGIVAITSLFIKNNLQIKYSILFGIFLTGTVFASTQGIRFTFLVIPIIAILIGVTSGKIYDELTKALHENLSIQKTLSRVVIIIFLMWILLPTHVNAGYRVASNQIPMYNDAWDNTMNIIKDSSEDAIITSWWDFGHWFVAKANRRVTFDGGDQGRRIHWVGKTLLTSNETEAVNILRMLNCGQENASHELDKYFSEYETTQILYQMLEVNDKDKAELILKEHDLNDETINLIMKNMYCDDLIDNYFIASSDMIGKSGVWGHFGSWDFNRSNLFNQVKNSDLRTGLDVLVNQYDYSETLARATYNEIKTMNGEEWIAEWPSYMSNEGSCNQENNTIQCTNGVVIDLNTMEAFAMTQDGLLKVKSISYLDDDEFKYKVDDDYDLDVGIALFPNGLSNSSIIMHEALTASMFTRMFFFEGFGLNHFEYLSYERGIDGIEVYLYKVNFDGK